MDMLKAPAFRHVLVEHGSDSLEVPHRRLAGAGGGGVCHQDGAFLGVGNVDCLHQNLGTAIFLLAVIVIVSLLFERLIYAVRRAIACPQLKRIVNRLFEEVMIMGFISMIIFTLNTSGLMEKLHFMFGGDLRGEERLHFYEFFHYLVFLTMIYFIAIVLFLLFVGTVVPKLVWEIKNASDADSEDSDAVHDSDLVDDDDSETEQRWGRPSQNQMDTVWASDDRLSRREMPSTTSIRQLQRQKTIRGRANSGMDLVQGSRAYALLLQRYQREGWWFRFNLKKQWHLWKSFEILAYNICQHRSGYIYKNPAEMERLFGVVPTLRGDGEIRPMTYEKYNRLCMRNLLYNISHLHYSAFFVLLLIAVVPVLYPEYDHFIFIGVGTMLLIVNVVIFFKVLHILRGIVDDRLRVFTSHDIQGWMPRLTSAGRASSSRENGRPPSLRVVALGVRAVIRMQMSALCHHQLHFHNDRFWFNSPRFLLRLFHFATIGQAFYLVWFSLVEWQTVAHTASGYYLIPTMVLLPFLAMCVITPMTMPSLVLVMSLTGIFVELNDQDPRSGAPTSAIQTKTRIRLMRRSYMKSHYTDTAEPPSPAREPAEPRPLALADTTSPTAVFLRMYDSPTAAIKHGKFTDSFSPRPTFVDREDGPLIGPRRDSDLFSTGHSDDLKEYNRTRRSFDSSYPSAVKSPPSSHRKASLDLGQYQFSPRPAAPSRDGTTPSSQDSAMPISSPAFQNYCSKYGGYPDA